MSFPAKGKKTSNRSLRTWTVEEARAVSPYLKSVLTSLRDTRLEWHSRNLEADRLAAEPGRPGRSRLLKMAEARRAAAAAATAYEEARQDLLVLDIVWFDPLAGQALLPFLQDNRLAAFVFDLHRHPQLEGWRYHDDALDVRRPLPEAESTCTA